MSRKHRSFVLLASLYAVSAAGTGIIGPRDAAAQELWTEATTLGFTALGMGIAGAVVLGSECSGCTLGAGFAVVAAGAGFGIGNLIGSRAEAAARRDERPSGAELAGVRVGTVLAGAALGTLAGGILVNRKREKSPGDDERSVLLLAGLGAAVGGFVEYRQEAWLRGLPTEDADLIIAPTADGAFEVGVALRTN